MNRFAHALVVGGSGMLADCCRDLLNVSDRVSVLARNERRIRAIAPAIVPVVCDYNDAAAFTGALESMPAPNLVVAWVHGPAPSVRRALAVRLSKAGQLVQILGSASADPSHPERLSDARKAGAGLPIDVQTVVLGFAIEHGRSRWLTDREISDGVFAAIQRGERACVVGAVEPWSARP